MVVDLLAYQLRVYLLFPRLPNLAGWSKRYLLDYSEWDIIAPYHYDRWLTSIQPTEYLPHLFDQRHNRRTSFVEDEFCHIVPHFHIGKLLTHVSENSVFESSMSP